MFCPYCKTKWADFPKEDFDFSPNWGIKAKSEQAGLLRLIQFNSEEEASCPDCRGEVSKATLYRKESDEYGRLIKVGGLESGPAKQV